MLAVEDVLTELAGDEVNDRGLPPGFRFHPTDEELVTFYLASKVLNGGLCGFEIAEVDLNRCEPWELPEIAKMGEREWYFFSQRDRKYPTGLRTNRATAAGYWKATGKDKEIFGGGGVAPPVPLLGMKKTLVFYKGRAPRGVKTKWVMHEYRLDGELSLRHTCKDEWVICRVFNKTGDRSSKHVGIHGHHSFAMNIHQNLERSYSASSSSSSSSTLITHFPLSSSSSSSHHLLNHLHDNDLKTLINPVVSHLNTLIFSSDHQGKKHIMKAESGDNYFIDYGASGEIGGINNNDDLGLLDPFQNPLFQEPDYNLLGLSSSTGDFHHHVMFDSSTAAQSLLLDQYAN